MRPASAVDDLLIRLGLRGKPERRLVFCHWAPEDFPLGVWGCARAYYENLGSGNTTLQSSRPAQVPSSQTSVLGSRSVLA